jgi:hypothetical protein
MALTKVYEAMIVGSPDNIMSYGAVNDGVTDCSAACLAMYQATGRINFPAGDWRLNSSVDLPTSCLITGAGPDKTTIYLNAAYAFKWGDSTFATQGIKPYGLSGVTVTPVGGAYTANRVAVKMYNAVWFTISNNIFYNLGAGAIYAGGGCWDGVVTNNHFERCGAASVPVLFIKKEASSSTSNNHWKIFANQFEGSYFTDLRVEGGLAGEDDHKIFGNKFGSYQTNNTWATDQAEGQFHITLYQTTGPSIQDNWFFEGGMVRCDYTNSVQINDNFGRELSQGILLFCDGYQQVAVSNNLIEGNNSSTAITGSLVANHFGVYVWLQNGTITNNYVVKFNGGVYDRSGSVSNSYGLNNGQADSLRPSLNGTTPLVARYDYSASAAPLTGTYYLGDIVYNNAPTSGGYIGWVCTVAGTPGTWKTFGLIS